MICRICREDINEKGQDNISPISGYPVCEDCKEEIMCEECCEGNLGSNLFYIEEWDTILCRDCLVAKAAEEEIIHSITHYYTQEYHKICSDADLEPAIDHLKEVLDIQEVTQ